MLKIILIIIVIVTGGSVALGPTKRFLRRHKLLQLAVATFAVASGLLAAIEILVSADSVVNWFSRKFGPSEEQQIAAAIKNCNSDLNAQCIIRGGAYAPDSTLAKIRKCDRPEFIRSDNPTLNWRDVWTTSVYSYQPGGGGPGGGRDDDVLKVGGWGDWYFSLIKFDLPIHRTQPKFVFLALFSKSTEGASEQLMLDQLVNDWNFPKGGTLWWRDRPGQRAAIADPLPAPKRDQWYIIEITSLYSDWSDRKIRNYGLQLRPVHVFGSFVFFASSDEPNKNVVPRLLFCF